MGVGQYCKNLGLNMTNLSESKKLKRKSKAITVTGHGGP
jgi:hypothetical protein